MIDGLSAVSHQGGEVARFSNVPNESGRGVGGAVHKIAGLKFMPCPVAGTRGVVLDESDTITAHSGKR